MSIVTDILHRSQAVSALVKPRTAEKVYLHFLSELGELAEEANIAAGELYKQPGDDGVVGETADVMNCIGDLIWVTAADKAELASLMADIARIVDIDSLNSERSWPDFKQANTAFAEETARISMFYQLSNGRKTITEHHVRVALARFIRSLLMLAKAADPTLSNDRFLEIYAAKCAKWLAKAS